MQTIYIDILIVLNIYVNFFLLRTAAGLTHSPLKNLRCAAASFYGSLYSLLILAPELPPVIAVIIRLFAAFTITAAAFGFHGRLRLIINTGAFFAANFILAGLMYAVYPTLLAGRVHFNNSYFYIDFSLMILVVTTVALYAVVYAARYFLDRFSPQTGSYRVLIHYKNRVIDLAGLADTGNSLVDFFSGAPVIVCDGENFPEMADLVPDKLPRGVRVIPCRTVSGAGLMPVFKPDDVLIINGVSGQRKPVDAVIGLGSSSGKAVFNPVLLKY